MFNGIFGGGDGPGMADIMKLLAPLMAGGSPQEKVTKFIQKVATPENIKEYTGNIIERVKNMQAAKGLKYVLAGETTVNGKDIIIRVWHRDSNADLHPIRELYLSQLTQHDLISLISLFFNDGTATKSIAAPGQ